MSPDCTDQPGSPLQPDLVPRSVLLGADGGELVGMAAGNKVVGSRWCGPWWLSLRDQPRFYGGGGDGGAMVKMGIRRQHRLRRSQLRNPQNP